jgi:hypothetical protein
VTGSREHGNEPSGSIKYKKLHDHLSDLLVSKEEFSSMELVNISLLVPENASEMFQYLFNGAADKEHFYLLSVRIFSLQLVPMSNRPYGLQPVHSLFTQIT